MPAKIYRVRRSEMCCGEWSGWFVDKLFSTREKAAEWIENNQVSYTRQDVVEQYMD